MLSKLRSFIFRIEKTDLHLYLPLTLMIFALSACDSILMDFVNACLIKYNSSQMVFLSTGFLILYLVLLRFVPRQYILMGSFLAIFGCFVGLYPKIKVHPEHYEVFVNVFLQYARSWPMLMIVFCFWQFCVNTLTMDQAKRYFISFLLIWKFGGDLPIFIDFYPRDIFNISVHDVFSVFSFVTVCSIIAMICFYYVNRVCVESQNSNYLNYLSDKNVRFMDLLTSKPLWFMVLIIFCAGIAEYFLSIQFKYHLKNFAHSDKIIYTNMMGDYSVVAALSSIFFCFIPLIFKRLNWYKLALIVPIIFSVCVLAIFGLNFVHSKEAVYAFLLFASMAKGVVSGLGFVVLMWAFVAFKGNEKTYGITICDGYVQKLGVVFGMALFELLLVITESKNIPPAFNALIFMPIALWIFGLKKMSYYTHSK